MKFIKKIFIICMLASNIYAGNTMDDTEDIWDVLEEPEEEVYIDAVPVFKRKK